VPGPVLGLVLSYRILPTPPWLAGHASIQGIVSYPDRPRTASSVVKGQQPAFSPAFAKQVVLRVARFLSISLANHAWSRFRQQTMILHLEPQPSIQPTQPAHWHQSPAEFEDDQLLNRDLTANTCFATRRKRLKGIHLTQLKILPVRQTRALIYRRGEGAKGLSRYGSGLRP
jgi:hypothetical protein